MPNNDELMDKINDPQLRASMIYVLSIPNASNEYKFNEIKNILKENELQFTSPEAESIFNNMLVAIMEDAPKKQLPEVLQEILDSIIKIFTGRNPEVERAHNEFKRMDAHLDNAIYSVNADEKKIFGKFTQKVIEEKSRSSGGPQHSQLE